MRVVFSGAATPLAPPGALPNVPVMMSRRNLGDVGHERDRAAVPAVIELSEGDVVVAVTTSTQPAGARHRHFGGSLAG